MNKLINKNSLIAASLITSTLLFNVSPVFAVNDFGSDKFINNETKMQSQSSIATQKKQENQEKTLTNLKQKADKAIDHRVDELKRLSSRIQSNSKLSADEKTSLSANIQSNISGLTALKVKIDADTDVTTTRADIKQVTTFKISTIVVPQTRLLITINNLSVLNIRLQRLTTRLQNLINNLKSQGKDVTTVQSLLDDTNSQLSTINSKLSQDKSTVLGVTPSSSDPQATFTSVRQDLADVRADFAKVRSDISKIRIAFKGVIHNTTGGPTSTPT